MPETPYQNIDQSSPNPEAGNVDQSPAPALPKLTKIPTPVIIGLVSLILILLNLLIKNPNIKNPISSSLPTQSLPPPTATPPPSQDQFSPLFEILDQNTDFLPPPIDPLISP